MLGLRQRDAARGTFQTDYGLRFFYQHTLGRAWEEKGSPRHGRSSCLTRYRTIRSVACSAVSATRPTRPASPSCMPVVCASAKPPRWKLAPSTGANQVLRIVGKGDKERLLPLPQPVLDELATCG